jgi:hypothetical protein
MDFREFEKLPCKLAKSAAGYFDLGMVATWII